MWGVIITIIIIVFLICGFLSHTGGAEELLLSFICYSCGDIP